jgi:hypothetical protein
MVSLGNTARKSVLSRGPCWYVAGSFRWVLLDAQFPSLKHARVRVLALLDIVKVLAQARQGGLEPKASSPFAIDQTTGYACGQPALRPYAGDAVSDITAAAAAPGARCCRDQGGGGGDRKSGG